MLEINLIFVLAFAAPAADAAADDRLRIIIETDAGGDPDDEQSLVRFLLYANEWDVEGIIANRPQARDGENLNTARTGLSIVERQLDAYEACYPKLALHDRRFPEAKQIRERTVAGYADREEGVRLITEAIDRDDPRPVWFCNWGTDNGSSPSCLKRALDQVLAERGKEGYARFKNKLRLASDDQFGDHTTKIEPPFPIWIDTFRPELNRLRWYHRFSALTATAGGFDIERDCRTGHGPLGALYPTNTTHKQKEGDSGTFVYLIPNGLNAPEHPGWGGWAGRYGPREGFDKQPYFWANQTDTWRGTTSRDNTLARWAEHLQNDFRARLDWCVQEYEEANHPPQVRLAGDTLRKVRSGDRVELDASATTDPDKDRLTYAWLTYPEAGTYRGSEPEITGSDTAKAALVVPPLEAGSPPATLHLVLAVTDAGSPPLTRYARVVLEIGK